MTSKKAKKIFAVFDGLEKSLRRVNALPPDALTLEEKLELWAYNEMLRLKVIELRNSLADVAKQNPGS